MFIDDDSSNLSGGNGTFVTGTDTQGARATSADGRTERLKDSEVINSRTLRAAVARITAAGVKGPLFILAEPNFYSTIELDDRSVSRDYIDRYTLNMVTVGQVMSELHGYLGFKGFMNAIQTGEGYPFPRPPATHNSGNNRYMYIFNMDALCMRFISRGDAFSRYEPDELAHKLTYSMCLGSKLIQPECVYRIEYNSEPASGDKFDRAI